jgi:hypothetical protein
MLRYRASNRKNKNSVFHSIRTCVSRCLSAFFPCQSAKKETGGAVSQSRSSGNPSASTEPASRTAKAVSVLMSVGIFLHLMFAQLYFAHAQRAYSITHTCPILLETDCAPSLHPQKAMHKPCASIEFARFFFRLWL